MNFNDHLVKITSDQNQRLNCKYDENFDKIVDTLKFRFELEAKACHNSYLFKLCSFENVHGFSDTCVVDEMSVDFIERLVKYFRDEGLDVDKLPLGLQRTACKGILFHWGE